TASTYSRSSSCRHGKFSSAAGVQRSADHHDLSCQTASGGDYKPGQRASRVDGRSEKLSGVIVNKDFEVWQSEQRPGLPGGDFGQHRVGDAADEVRGHLSAVHLGQKPLDLP